MSFSLEPIILWLQSWPPGALLPFEALLCFAAVLSLHRFFGAAGLFVYLAVAVIGANIEVLKAVQFPFYPAPVGLGTILFSSTYLATDILTERYGPEMARKGVWLSFAAFLTFTLCMLITLGYAPLTPEQAGADSAWALPYHNHLQALFLPAPALFIAGMCSYLTSQYTDVWIYMAVKRATSGKHLWLRNNASTMLSALLDNIIFSILAWRVFAPEPLPWGTVIFTYILGTYWLRLAVSACDTPFFYLAMRWKPTGEEKPA